jgi:hypothetical protein
MLSFFFPDRLGAPASRAGEAEAPTLVCEKPSRQPGTPAILPHSGGGLPLFCAGGGVVPLGGGGALGLGLVLGGGGGGFCSGAPPGCELGALAGGFACSLDGGGAFGVVVSLGGALAEPPPLFELPLPPHAAADSESAAMLSNNKLRFIRITSHGSRQTEA